MVQIKITGSTGTIKTVDVSVDTIILFVKRGFTVTYKAFSIKVNGISSIGATPSTTSLFSTVTIQQLKNFGFTVEIISSGFLSLTGRPDSFIRNVFNVTPQEVKSIFGLDVTSTPTPIPTPPPITTLPKLPLGPGITGQEISVSPGAFMIINDRVKGEAIFIASPTFEDSQAKAVLQISVGTTPLRIKENTLNFSPTQRDERISYDENAFGESELNIIISVFNSQGALIGSKSTFKITPPTPTVPQPFRPTGPERQGVAGTPFGVAAIGILGMGILGALGVGGKKK